MTSLWSHAAAVMLMAAAAASVAARADAPGAAQTGSATPRRVLVMPFEAQGSDPRAYWMREGSAVLLTDDLLALKAAPISRDDRLRAFERLRLPVSAALTHATVIRVGEMVGATDVVVGTLTLAGDILTVRARTIRLDAGRLAPDVTERGPRSEMFAIYARIARALVPDSTVTLDDMERDHPPPAAFEFYVKGLLAQSSAARIGHLTEALRIAPAFQRPRVALWAVHQDDGEYQRALGVVSAVPATHRLSRQARFLSAISLLELGRHQEAHDRLTALNRDAPDPALLNNLGVVQVRRPAGAAGGRASTWFADAMALNPADPDLAFNHGYAAWLERNMATAMSALREVVRRDPTDAEAHYVLGLALQASGAAAEGARERDLGKRLSATLAEFDARQGPVAQAPRGLERLKREIDVPAGWRVDDLMVAAGQRDQRDQARFHLEAGQRLFVAQRDAEAAVELRRAVYLSPYDSEAHLLLGRIHLRAARLQDAVDAFKIAIWSDDTPAARVALAEAFLALNDAASARSELEAALRRDANHVEATRLLNGLSR